MCIDWTVHCIRYWKLFQLSLSLPPPHSLLLTKQVLITADRINSCSSFHFRTDQCHYHITMTCPAKKGKIGILGRYGFLDPISKLFGLELKWHNLLNYYFYFKLFQGYLQLCVIVPTYLKWQMCSVLPYNCNKIWI